MEVIVIGGGLAGLTAANVLADRRVQVTVLEAKGRFGEAAAVRDSRLYRLPTGMTSISGASALPPGGRLALGKWFSSVSLTKPAAVAHLSVAQWLEREISREDVRAVAGALTRIVVYSTELGRLSADAAVLQLKLTMKPRSVRYVHGGWQSGSGGAGELSLSTTRAHHDRHASPGSSFAEAAGPARALVWVSPFQRPHVPTGGIGGTQTKLLATISTGDQYESSA